MRILTAFALLFLISVSCTNQPDLTGFDVESFKKDRGSCGGTREKQIDWLETQLELIEKIGIQRYLQTQM